MGEPTLKIVHDARNVVFHPSPNRVTYLDDPDSPLLKRRAPKRPKQEPKQEPEQPKEDE